MKSASYYKKDISSQYVDALKKSIVAISYDVEGQQDMVECGEEKVFSGDMIHSIENRIGGDSPVQKTVDEVDDDLMYQMKKLRKA